MLAKLKVFFKIGLSISARGKCKFDYVQQSVKVAQCQGQDQQTILVQQGQCHNVC